MALERWVQKSMTRRFPAPDPSIIRLARADDVLPAFHRRCLFVKAAQARQTVRSAGMIGTTTRE